MPGLFDEQLSVDVDKERTVMDVTLRLPVSHFLTFKPMLDMVMQASGMPGAALFGGGGKGM